MLLDKPVHDLCADSYRYYKTEHHGNQDAEIDISDTFGHGLIEAHEQPVWMKN